MRAPGGGGDMAAFYDRLHALEPGGMRGRRAYRRLLELIDLRPGQMLLDVGCGTGALAALALECGGRAIGVDLSSIGLQAGVQAGMGGRLYLANALRLPLRDGACDTLTCYGSLQYLPDIPAGLAELARVLTPGGAAGLVVPNAGFPPFALARRRGRAAPAGPARAGRDAWGALLDLGEWRRLLVNAGFELLAVRKELGPELGSAPDAAAWLRRLLLKLWLIMPAALSYHLILICRRT